MKHISKLFSTLLHPNLANVNIKLMKKILKLCKLKAYILRETKLKLSFIKFIQNNKFDEKFNNFFFIILSNIKKKNRKLLDILIKVSKLMQLKI